MANTPKWKKGAGNQLNTTLASGITNSALTISLTSGSGFDTGGGYIVIDKDTASEEMIYYESRSGSTLTVATDGRGRGPLGAFSHLTGASVADIIMADMVSDPTTSFLVEHNDNGTHKVAALAALMYPVGSIYTSVVSTNPNTLFGMGTWVAFGAGRVMVGIDGAQTEFDTVEETGGAKTHTLSSAEMPSHTHTQNSHVHNFVFDQSGDPSNNLPGAGAAYMAGILSNTGGSKNKDTAAATATNQNTGGGGAHNNLPPYIVVYVWKRTV